MHKLATNREEVINCAASRYTYSPNTLALQEAMQQNIGPIAVVGVPCQIDGVRLQQNSSIRLNVSSWYRKNITGKGNCKAAGYPITQNSML